MLTFLILHFKPAAPLLVPCWWSFLMVALTKWPVKGLPAAPITLKGFVSPLLLPDNPILTADIRKYHCCFYRLCITFNRGAEKKAFFLGKVSPKVWTHPPTQGFCEIWENERWNSGQKRHSVIFERVRTIVTTGMNFDPYVDYIVISLKGRGLER